MSTGPRPEACSHQPTCPGLTSSDRQAAHLLVHHEDQGWSLLCNGLVLFDDLGELLPDGTAVRPGQSSGQVARAG